MDNQSKTYAPRTYSSKIWALAIATALTAACAIFFAPHFTQSTAARHAQKITASASQAPGATAVETNRIAPADVLGTGVQWAPRTGDGSN
jgi:hypothetical protein